MKKESKFDIRFKNSLQFFNIIQENVSGYDIIDENEGDLRGFKKVEVAQLITEYDFYRCFLYLKSSLAKTVYGNDESYISGVNIDYMAAIMAKSLDYSLPVKSKNNQQKLLADELGRTDRSAYSALNKLKNAGYLIITEDDLITPNTELQRLRNVTKNHIKKYGIFPVSYLFNFIISNQNEDSGSDTKKSNRKSSEK